MGAISIAALIFAAVFFAVGVTRVVEFNNLGLSAGQRRLLYVLHVLGCLSFSSSFVMLVLDTRGNGKTWTGALLVVGLGLLAPGQFTSGLRRKKRNEEEARNRPPGKGRP